MTRNWLIVVVLAAFAVGVLLAQQPVQLQTVNGGGALLLGNGVSAGTLRVTLSSDSTGQVTITGSPTVTLASGSQANAVPQSSSTYAATPFDLAATAATNIKGTAGDVWGWYIFNPNPSPCYLQFYNATAPTLGTNALHPLGVQAGYTLQANPGAIALFNLSTAISTGQATTATGGAQCAAPMIATILYN